jgi:mono/diheme cytochrome c family protein
LRLLLALILLPALFGIASAGGAEVFNSRCAICHQPNGNGLPGMYPPLADSIGRDVTVPQGRAYLVHVVSFGMTGPISVHGQLYNGLMQSWPALSDDEIAQVLDYALANFNARVLPKHFSPLTAAEVEKDRAANISVGDVRKERDALMKLLDSRSASP